MRKKALLGILVLVGVALVSSAAGPGDKLDWQTTKEKEVVIFGDISRGGFYSLPEKGMTLRQFVVSAGIPKKSDDYVVQLRRPAEGDSTKFVEVQMKALDKDGNIDLKPNDVVYVSAAK